MLGLEEALGILVATWVVTACGILISSQNAISVEQESVNSSPAALARMAGQNHLLNQYPFQPLRRRSRYRGDNISGFIRQHSWDLHRLHLRNLKMQLDKPRRGMLVRK